MTSTLASAAPDHEFLWSDDHGNVTMVMTIRTISASRFKAQCLAMLDEVAATGEEIVVTKRGRAVARVSPMSEPESLRSSVTFNVTDEELLEPLEIAWNATADA
ncbi:MAG TPA: type II toxin-antitoxin system Phd/YefM family antitoxin [Solirubrobacteraceae bacterium]|nr:type II toxin-antitoxin system Phd/YefM family antitoxin [Solirubrobacteraceae bacterium]